MTEIYITDNLVLQDYKLFIQQDDQLIKIKTSNIIKYLEDIGWEEIDDGWKEILSNYIRTTNIPYVIMECGGEGDCLFHCVAEAFNNVL